MTNIVPYDETPIVDEEALAKEHFELVKSLKKSLFVGQAGFIKAGQYLSKIRDKETYKYEDSQHDTSWSDFCSRPDLPLGGSSKEGRVRTSQKLMTVWNSIASRKDVDEKSLAEIGYTKLALVAGIINKDPDENLNDWLDKAKELSTEDLQAECSDGGKTLAEVNDCEHENYSAVDAWRCDDCKKFMKKEPGK